MTGLRNGGTVVIIYMMAGIAEGDGAQGNEMLEGALAGLVTRAPFVWLARGSALTGSAQTSITLLVLQRFSTPGTVAATVKDTTSAKVVASACKPISLQRRRAEHAGGIQMSQGGRLQGAYPRVLWNFRRSFQGSDKRLNYLQTVV